MFNGNTARFQILLVSMFNKLINPSSSMPPTTQHHILMLIITFYYLDCIGSAFNIKGAMQCPNCRKIEKGQWLYANGGRSYPEFSMDEWTHDEDLYDLSYSEMVKVMLTYCLFVIYFIIAPKRSLA